MIHKISGDDIWQVAKNDPRVMDVLPTPEHEQEMKQFVEFELLQALINLLPRTATLETILRAQISYAIATIQTGLTKRLAALDMGVEPDEIPPFVEQAVNGMLQASIAILQTIADDIPDYLAHFNTTEREQLEATALTPENVEKILRHEITIGDLLMSQPGIILQPQPNDDTE